MPSVRDAYRFLDAPPGYGGGYSSGYRPSNGSLLELTMEQGRIQAEQAQRSGDIWGSALMGLGQTIAGGIQQHQEQQALKKRDAAWLNTLNDPEFFKDPKTAYARTVSIWGPEKGPDMFKGVAAVTQLGGEKRDPDADMKALGAMGAAMDHMSPQGRAMLYPQAVALQRRSFPHIQLPDQYDDETWKAVAPFFSQMASGKAPEGFTLKPGEQRFDAAGKPVASVPAEPKAEPGFSLSPGVVRYDASGNVVASRPAAPKDRSGEPLEAIIGPDGNPVLVPRSQAAGKRPASSREQGRPVLSGDANRLAEMDTSLNDLATLSGTLSGNKATGAMAKAGAMLPNVVTEFTGLGSDAKQKQATIDRVKQVIGKALEGGVLRKEDEAKYEKILPTIGDPPDVVAAKLQGLERAITQRRQTLVESLGDAGFDTSRFQRRASGGQGARQVTNEAEYNALPSGAEYIDPDGVRRRKK